MKKALEELDLSMSILASKYGEEYLKSEQTLSLLAQQYQAFNTLMTMKQDDENYPYFIKYSNMENIKKY